jgi:predicted nucleic acid-binding protein
MRIIVSDSSIIIDLAKGELIEPALALPYEFVIPDALFENELIDLGRYRKADLPGLGLNIQELTPGELSQAIGYRSRYTALTTEDCFALTIAKVTQDAMLLTGDQNLRRAAETEVIEAHGLLWACEQIKQYQTVRIAHLHDALCRFRDDPTIWLPRYPLTDLIRRVYNQL